jgi:hypothetical protein
MAEELNLVEERFSGRLYKSLCDEDGFLSTTRTAQKRKLNAWQCLISVRPLSILTCGSRGEYCRLSSLYSGEA